VRTWDFIYDIIFLNSDMSGHCSQFQLLWPHGMSSSSPFRECGAAFRLYMAQMFDNTHDQMNNWGCDNPHAFGDLINRSNPQTSSSGKVKCTGERFSWYGSGDLKAKIEPTCYSSTTLATSWSLDD
jgi:hypothetical protein